MDVLIGIFFMICFFFFIWTGIIIFVVLIIMEVGKISQNNKREDKSIFDFGDNSKTFLRTMD